MKKRMGKLLMFLSLAFSFMISSPVQAEILPPGMLIGDSEGISVDGTGAYYVQKEDLQPGDKFVKKIKLMNTEKNDRPYVLEMDMAPKEKKGAIDFYEAITVVMLLDGKEVYNGNLIGIGKPDLQKDRLQLGTYAYGDFKELEVQFAVSSDLPAEVWETKSYAIIKWEFIATKEKDKPEPPIDSSGPPGDSSKPKDPIKKKPIIKLPQTGEEWRSLIYKAITGIFIICVVLLFIKKRRDSQMSDKE